MKYKFYFRKSSFKKDFKNGQKLLDLVKMYKPKHILEIGVLEGATSRNFCELLKRINGNNFNYTGIDLFNLDVDKNNKKEFTPVSNKFSNPFKFFYFKYILKLNPNSIEAVNHLLKKFVHSIKLYRGYSDKILSQLEAKNIDFVFLTETNGIHKTNSNGELPDQTSVCIGSIDELSLGNCILKFIFF